MVTGCLFPFLFLTLEIPKRIINDAIGTQSGQIIFGVQIPQIGFLGILCFAFLLAVLGHGLLKMRINTMKGVLSERMLRRLRYNLIDQMLRFPKPYFQRTSQGEMVTMITTETEPMGGLMGDALAQPVLQAGQMLTILFFLFLQSVWFGLAAIALIPLQAWLIPKLQRQINLMNKDRIREVRHLSALIGENAAGASDLRLHGGWRYRLAMMTDRLGIIYLLRFKIYQKKFFMKFINNFITQMTPFFFFSVGGYLVIQGAVSLGALVAALAAYKDLSSPWKELLTYYNQTQDMSLRWEAVAEKFSPNQGFARELMQDPKDDFSLAEDISIENVDVTDADGVPVLQDVSAAFKQGAVIAITARSETDRLAFADLLTREVVPVKGRVMIGAHSLKDLPQSALARKIGHVSSKPLLFQGTFRENVLMPLMMKPRGSREPSDAEATMAGNSPDNFSADWLDLKAAQTDTEAELRDLWLQLLSATGASNEFFRRALDQTVSDAGGSDLERAIVGLRAAVEKAVVQDDLARHVHRFDTEAYNPALTVVENLLFATPRRAISHKEFVDQHQFFRAIKETGLEPVMLDLSLDVLKLLNRIFGSDGTSHPIFRKLGLEQSAYERAIQIISALRTDVLTKLDDVQKTHLIGFTAQVTAEQIGDAFPQEMQANLLSLRQQHAEKLQATLADLFARLDSKAIAPGLTVMENALFGKISDTAGARTDELRGLVSSALIEAGLKPDVMDLIFNMELGLGGANLPAVFSESLALARAAIKRPDILVLDNPLAGYSQTARAGLPASLRSLLPTTTLIFIADQFDDTDVFDANLEIRQGRVFSETQTHTEEDEALTAELTRKLRALESTDLFGGLSRKQLRLLAFGAKWYFAKAGEVIFNKNDDPNDGAYMILSGAADLVDPGRDGDETLVTTVGAGTLVGELGLIRKEPRALSMRAQTDLETLRIGEEAFLSVVENDAATAFKLLQVVASYQRQ
ncbi:MAG: ABC transporter transmembrane domain-containing protein [Roseobacter sp.]